MPHFLAASHIVEHSEMDAEGYQGVFRQGCIGLIA